MTEQERSAFEACREQAPIDIWNAALAWLRSQGEPVAWLLPSIDVATTKQKIAEDWKSSNIESFPLYLAPQPAIPDGWRLVPVEPTYEMCTADWDVSLSDAHTECGVSECAWAAMLAAAPEPSK